MRLYLCGPMAASDKPNQNRQAFIDTAATLRAAGHEVFSPVELAETDYHRCLRADLEAVLRSQAVAVLPGWEDGVGTRVEVAVAVAIGTPVLKARGLARVYPANAGRATLGDLLSRWTPPNEEPLTGPALDDFLDAWSDFTDWVDEGNL